MRYEIFLSTGTDYEKITSDLEGVKDAIFDFCDPKQKLFRHIEITLGETLLFRAHK